MSFVHNLMALLVVVGPIDIVAHLLIHILPNDTLLRIVRHLLWGLNGRGGFALLSLRLSHDRSASVGSASRSH